MSSAAPNPETSEPSASIVPTRPETIQQIPLNLIDPGPADDRRDTLDEGELHALANSISRRGVIQPIVVAPRDDRYITVAGRRRREAARIAGLTTIPAIVSDLTDPEAWETSTAENIYRSQLSPYEEAAAAAAAIQDGGLSLDQVAAAMGKSTRWVQDRLDMLSWPPEILEAVHRGKLSVAAAAPLVAITPEDSRKAIVAEAIRYGATARTTTAWAQASRAAHRNGNQIPADQLGDVPPVPPTIPHSPCWACGSHHPVSAMSYLPTCQQCYQTIPAAIAAAAASNDQR